MGDGARREESVSSRWLVVGGGCGCGWWVRAVSSVSPAKVDVQQRAVQAHARGERLLCT